VLQERYLLRDEEGRIIETPRKMMKRVARAVAEVDARYGKDVDKAYSEFYEMLTSLYFLPNSPTLMNAGTPLGQLSACFVLPVEDSIESIFDALREVLASLLLIFALEGIGFPQPVAEPRVRFLLCEFLIPLPK
jgi:ribonucleoside-diphosphate reductase alpha chain